MTDLLDTAGAASSGSDRFTQVRTSCAGEVNGGTLGRLNTRLQRFEPFQPTLEDHA
jgi:hypothetical protein